MQFKTITKQELKSKVEYLTIKDIKYILEFCEDELVEDNFDYLPPFVTNNIFDLKTKKVDYVNIIIKLFDDEKFKNMLALKLTATNQIKQIYEALIWKKIDVIGSEFNDEYNLGLVYPTMTAWESVEYNLDGVFGLISHHIYSSWQGISEDILFIKYEIREVLKAAFPLPDDYNIKIITSLKSTQLTYTNEDNVFNFIDTIEQMLKSNLVEFGKTNEKPLLKTLNVLKSSSGINEFFDKKYGLNVTDILTRSFSYYYWEAKKFEIKPLDSLKRFILLQFNDKYRFWITRILFGHLKKVRFEEYYTTQIDYFDFLKDILKDLPLDGYVDIENILSYCKYRNMTFHLDSEHKTNEYMMNCDINRGVDGIINDDLKVKHYFDIIYFDPIVKASFFYLASLGLLELKYNSPKSIFNFTAKNKDYLTIWDNLEYIKLTKLGLYIFGKTKEYEVKVSEKKHIDLKFDEYKPIITVDKSDSINIAKLEPYTISYGINKYILNSSKIFKDCKTYDALKIKIDNFYKIIDKDLPKVFIDFFEQLLNQSNLVTIEPEIITLQLKKDMKIVALFQKDKKLQDIIIKAENYKVLVYKKDLVKFIRILKDNGFFIEI